MTKQVLRKKYKQLRASLDAESIEKLSSKIASRLDELPIWDKQYYHLFLSIVRQYEVNTSFIRDILDQRNKKIVISKSDFTSHSLSHYLLTKDSLLIENRYGIPEPISGKPIRVDEIDVIFVPLLTFDMQGHRVGYGKGFYDNFLGKCRTDSMKIGLSFFPPESKIEGISLHDISLDYGVTPEKCYNFNF